MNDNITGHCMRCRVKEGRQMVDVEKVEMKPGRFAAKGKCAVCGTVMYRMLPKSDSGEAKQAA